MMRAFLILSAITGLVLSQDGSLMQGSYNDAQKVCEGLNQYLPSPKELQRTLKERGWTHVDLQLWVGLRRIKYKEWKTLNGSHYVNHINRARTEAEDCGIFLVKDWRIGEVHCNRIIGGFVCLLKERNRCPLDAEACKESYAFYKKETATWYVGFDECSKRGTVMAAIPFDHTILSTYSEKLHGEGHYAVGVAHSLFLLDTQGQKVLPESFYWEENNPRPEHDCATLHGNKLRSSDCKKDSAHYICVSEAEGKPSKRVTHIDLEIRGSSKTSGFGTNPPLQQEGSLSIIKKITGNIYALAAWVIVVSIVAWIIIVVLVFAFVKLATRRNDTQQPTRGQEAFNNNRTGRRGTTAIGPDDEMPDASISKVVQLVDTYSTSQNQSENDVQPFTGKTGANGNQLPDCHGTSIVARPVDQSATTTNHEDEIIQPGNPIEVSHDIHFINIRSDGPQSTDRFGTDSQGTPTFDQVSEGLELNTSTNERDASQVLGSDTTTV